MSTQIDASVLKNFLVNNLGINKLSRSEAKDYDVDSSKFTEADVDVDEYLDIDEILEDDDLYSNFASICVNSLEENKDVDQEKEKEKAIPVTGKGGSSL